MIGCVAQNIAEIQTASKDHYVCWGKKEEEEEEEKKYKLNVAF